MAPATTAITSDCEIEYITVPANNASAAHAKSSRVGLHCGRPASASSSRSLDRRGGLVHPGFTPHHQISPTASAPVNPSMRAVMSALRVQGGPSAEYHG